MMMMMMTTMTTTMKMTMMATMMMIFECSCCIRKNYLLPVCSFINPSIIKTPFLKLEKSVGVNQVDEDEDD